MSVTVYGVSERGVQRLEEALTLLRSVAPADHAHFFREIETIAHLPGACDGAVACTAGRFGRAAGRRRRRGA